MDHIIDGHNLISKLPGLSLSLPDDEERLLALLERYCAVGGHRVEVYFDGAPAGQAGMRKYGRVRAYFVSHHSSADEAIRRRLVSLAKSARNWLLVTSDRVVQAAGREARARVISSEDFARDMLASLQPDHSPEPASHDQLLSEAEVQQWEKIFNERRLDKPDER
jgi:predicted RNA-binding protein with PIN domain